MKPKVICYAESTPIRTIYEFLGRVSVQRVVIIEDGRPTGTISRGSLLRWFRSVVLTSGRMDETGAPSDTWNLDPSQSKERLAETALELAHQASGLHQQVHDDVDDLVPQVIGGATRMHGLLDDLLAFSRYANESTGK